jgi:hypothetical protein
MKLIIKPSCTGKTRELIEYSLETNTPFLVVTDSKKKSLEEKGLAYFSRVPWIITLDDAKFYNGPVLIDDADQVLNQLLKWYVSNVEVVALSITKDC